jgi:hypothetical protein
MRITANTTVGQLIDEHPEAEDVLAWHGIDITDLDEESRLSQVCRAFRKNLNDVIEELVSALPEDEDDEDDEIEDGDEDTDTWDEDDEPPPDDGDHDDGDFDDDDLVDGALDGDELEDGALDDDEIPIEYDDDVEPDDPWSDH